MADQRLITSEPGRDRQEADSSGVDITLIRWFLSLTPAQRLDYLQNHNDAILAIRARNARH
ncbi:MAG: hypothetical protein FJW20_10355 [Acidimicrobiia bacterium]|nr:hypothetical protein [Acidimicrobiia bacterium]